MIASRFVLSIKGKEGLEIRPRAPWAQRMIQIELSLLYLATFWSKTLGPAWVDGTALYYVYRLNEFHRFPMPEFLNNMALIKLQTWFTLAAEFSLGALVWIKELRYPVLLLGVFLHLSLEYSLNAPMFQWTILSLYLTFLELFVIDAICQWCVASAVCWCTLGVVEALRFWRLGGGGGAAAQVTTTT